jgi:hypothetical protein
MSRLATVTWLEGRHRVCRTGWVRQDTQRIYLRHNITWQILCYKDQLVNIHYHTRSTK